MLPTFKLLRPTTVSEAASELRRLGDSAKLYAGGAELALLMRHGLVDPEYFIDIKSIPDLGRIAAIGSAVTIGACATHHRIERDPAGRQHPRARAGHARRQPLLQRSAFRSGHGAPDP